MVFLSQVPKIYKNLIMETGYINYDFFSWQGRIK